MEFKNGEFLFESLEDIIVGTKNATTIASMCKQTNSHKLNYQLYASLTFICIQ